MIRRSPTGICGAGARDVSQACRLGIEADVSGADVFTIAAANTLMKTPSRGRRVADKLGKFETLLSIEKARRVLGHVNTETSKDIGCATFRQALFVERVATSQESAKNLRNVLRVPARFRAMKAAPQRPTAAV
jgi:hypothetical protein